jgi:hypothetical protein
VVWVAEDESISPVPVKAGLSDGVWTELIDAPFSEGTRLVTRVVLGDTGEQTAPQSNTNNPLLGSQPRWR